ncbi:TIGR02646 family protein [Geitlerinema sp. CS-897]|nr:TIGR02646 family protein [Geitlerinema sp. CS-897]
MKYIRKGTEPKRFEEWKQEENEDWKPSYDDNFQNPEKQEVHEALLKEQGYICCYCERQIDRSSSHIEHLIPRNQRYDLALAYDNLFASCQGESETPPPKSVHCGHKKAEWYDETLMVSPLQEDCETFFRYTEDGQILASRDVEKNKAATTTIDKLGLDIPKLRRMRQAAIEGFLGDIDRLLPEQIETLLNWLSQSKQGQFEAFGSAIAYVLKQYY